jgi:predicted ATP-binding protein involved in virulence
VQAKNKKMKENFITNIKINKSRNIENFEIPLSQDNRQHLIITGKNGSGKTSLLVEINKFFNQIESGDIQNYKSYKDSILDYKKMLQSETDSTKISQHHTNIEHLHNDLNRFGGTQIDFSNSYNEMFRIYQSGTFLVAFFDAKRQSNLTVPQGINKIDLKKRYNLNQKANPEFIQYIVNLKADRSFARDENELETVKKIDKWFDKLENRLQSIFDSNSLKLVFNRKTYNFDIIIDGLEPFNFNNLSDGYSAIISIVTELLLRMEAHNKKSYDLEGVVIIDEIETHLHVDLQKKILPFLVDFFPRIQFILTTHSPFVLSSLSNATICDLEAKIITTDLTSYSYDALIESYFKSDKYSNEVKVKIFEFDMLVSKTNKTIEEKNELRNLRNYFAHAPKYLSKELLVRLQQIELSELNTKK